VPSSLGVPKALDSAVDRYMFPRFVVGYAGGYQPQLIEAPPVL
jgi:hypothetical protein